MVRGNWQRRVELTASARQAYKLQKESRRNKSSQQTQRQHRSNSIAGEDSYTRLEQWLDENGDGILFGRRSSLPSGENDAVEGGATMASTTTTTSATSTSNSNSNCNCNSGKGTIITVDIWTQSPPKNRPEYQYLEEQYYYEDSFTDDHHRDYTDKNSTNNNDSRSKGGGGRGSIKKKTKGKAHPNAKNKSSSSSNTLENSDGAMGGSAGGGGGGGGRDRSSSISSQNGKDYDTNTKLLCAREFFFGKEKCKGTQQLLLAKKGGGGGGGRKGRSSSIGAEDDTNNNTTVGGGAGCCLRHYHQLPKNKHRKALPSSMAAPTLPPPPTPPMTFAQVLNDKFYSPHHSFPNDNKPSASLPVGVREAILKSSYDASSIKNEDGNNASLSSTSAYIDMVYHTRFFVDDTVQSVSSNSKSTDDDDDAAGGVDEISLTRSKIHEALQRILNEYNIPSLTSVVYLTIQGVVIFDRYRGGLVVTEKEERFLLFGEAIPVDTYLVETKKNLDDYDDGIDDSSVPIYERLTHNLLDEILAYSEDECAGILPRVCKSWREEIGSSQLWSMLLDRHGWPMRVNGDDDNENGGGGRGDEEDDDHLPSDDDIANQCEHLRKSFISHYSVLRDVRALSNASTYIMAGGGSASMGSSIRNNRLDLESAMLIFNQPNDFSHCNRHMVKIWPEDKYEEELSARALATYYDCTLRLFEVVRGNNDGTVQGWMKSQGMKCRQVACLRVAPPSVSRKKGRCEIVGMDMDDDNVVCLIGEKYHEQLPFTSTSWMTVISRDDVVCAGNEGFLQSFDLRGVIIDFILSGTEGDIFLQELQGALHAYLSLFDGDTSAVEVTVDSELISCGRGIFLFSACTRIPGCAEEEEEDEEEDVEYDRLFLFSVRTRSIVNSLHHERFDECLTLFASRPFKSRSVENSDEVLRTNILIELSTELQFVSVEIGRTGSTCIFTTAMINRREFALTTWFGAVLTSSHAIFTTSSPDGLVLHFHRLLQSSYPNRKVIGEQKCRVQNLFIIREHYVAVVIRDDSNEQDEDELFDGEWLGLNESAVDERESFSIIVYHIPTAQEVCRCPLSLPVAYHSFDCIGDTLAMNVSNMGFVITGGNARDVGRSPMETVQTMTSPSGKQPKGKKKRLVSLACGRKKDGFARGMSLRG